MEQGAIEWVAGQTGIMGVASMALFFLRRAYDQSLAREKQYSEENRADKLIPEQEAMGLTPTPAPDRGERE